MFGQEFIDSKFEFGIMKGVLSELAGRGQISKQLKKHSPLSEETIRRIWGLCSSYCKLYELEVVESDESMLQFVLRQPHVKMEEVLRVLELAGPIPKPHGSLTCKHSELLQTPLRPLGIGKCPECSALVICDCTSYTVRALYAYPQRTLITKSVCALCSQSEPTDEGVSANTKDAFYMEHGYEILELYARKSCQYKSEHPLVELLDNWHREETKPGSIASMATTGAEILLSCINDDPWVRFLVQEGASFVPRSVKKRIMRESENELREKLGLTRIRAGGAKGRPRKSS
jgi:hypothetical protein